MQPAEVLSDSILENKEVTKSYWEERMMSMSGDEVFAVAATDEPAAPPAAPRGAVAGDDAESRIAVELREMREREEELKQLRQRISSGNLLDSMATDEGNCSEYGSEENKELSIDGSSRVMSPEVPLQGSFGHQRTQSMDSMSSGHSSGSGGAQDVSLSGTTNLPFRRRITVKPLDEPEDDESAYSKCKLGETPIEREIRVAGERELELRREKGVGAAAPAAVAKSPPGAAAAAKQSWKPALVNDSRDVQHRIATSRIQQEIQEATQREKELVATGTIQTLSEDTVDSKVTRFTELAEYAMAEKAKQQSKAADAPADPAATPVAEIKRAPLKTSPVAAPPPPLSRLRSFDAPSGQQRGLMQRFLASKGQIMFGSTQSIAFVADAPAPFSPPTTPFAPHARFEMEEEQSEPKLPPTTPLRKGFMSAENKIQEELQEMKKREDELKLQRMHILAQSQPNLLDLLDIEDNEANEEGEEEVRRDVATLSKALSNPNLLDASSYQDSCKKLPGTRKRSALIDQWESLIQKNSQQV